MVGTFGKVPRAVIAQWKSAQTQARLSSLAAADESGSKT